MSEAGTVLLIYLAIISVAGWFFVFLAPPNRTEVKPEPLSSKRLGTQSRASRSSLCASAGTRCTRNLFLC